MNKSESKFFNTAIRMDRALIALLKRKSFEFITISELCKEAGVNRSTFYLHYETLGDLLKETTQYLLDDFSSNFPCNAESVFRSLKYGEAEGLNFICEAYLTPYLTYISNNKELFATALEHQKTLGLEKVYHRLFENIFNPILDRFQYSQGSRHYVMMYYLNGLNAIIFEWLKQGCKKPIDEISEIIRICIYGKENKDIPSPATP